MRTISLLFLALAGLHGQVLQAIAAGSGASAPGGGACTPAAGYAHCRVLTINSAQVGGSTLSYFPVLVRATLGASRIQNGSCYDVVFTRDAAGITPIPWEQETCSASTGAIVDWVLLPSISPTVNTSFYVSYGNAGVLAAANTGGTSPTQVWDSNYVIVAHLADGVNLAATDSTVNGNHGTNVGAMAVAGEIDGGAATSSGSGSYMSFNNPLPTANGSQSTISFWMKTGQVSATQGLFSWATGPTTGTNGTLLLQNNAGILRTLGNITTGSYADIQAISAGTWYYLVLEKQLSGAGPTNVYVNGVLVGSNTGDNTCWSCSAFYLGSGYPGASDSVLDEFRVSKVWRPAGWITAEYNNQVAGGSFLAVGPEF